MYNYITLKDLRPKLPKVIQSVDTKLDRFVISKNGIPVAVIGILGYAAILAVHLFEHRNAFFKQNGALMIFGMALTGFIFTVWLVYVELVLLKAICPFCVTSQAAMTFIFMIAVMRLFKHPQS